MSFAVPADLELTAPCVSLEGPAQPLHLTGSPDEGVAPLSDKPSSIILEAVFSAGQQLKVAQADRRVYGIAVGQDVILPQARSGRSARSTCRIFCRAESRGLQPLVPAGGGAVKMDQKTPPHLPGADLNDRGLVPLEIAAVVRLDLIADAPWARPSRGGGGPP